MLKHERVSATDLASKSKDKGQGTCSKSNLITSLGQQEEYKDEGQEARVSQAQEPGNSVLNGTISTPKTRLRLTYHTKLSIKSLMSKPTCFQVVCARKLISIGQTLPCARFGKMRLETAGVRINNLIDANQDVQCPPLARAPSPCSFEQCHSTGRLA